MAHCAEKLAIQRERCNQLTWKADIEVHHCQDFIMVAIPCLDSYISESDETCLDGISAIAIPYKPPSKC